MREYTSLPDGCTLAKTRNQSRECRPDNRGTGLVYYDVSYVEYYCSKVPTVRRLVISAKKSVPAAPCSERDYDDEAAKSAKLYGERWDERKSDPDEERTASPPQEPGTQTPVKDREAANPKKPQDGEQAKKIIPPDQQPKAGKAKTSEKQTSGPGKGKSGFLTPQETEDLRKEQESDPNHEKKRAQAVDKIEKRNQRDEAGQPSKQASEYEKKSAGSLKGSRNETSVPDSQILRSAGLWPLVLSSCATACRRMPPRSSRPVFRSGSA